MSVLQLKKRVICEQVIKYIEVCYIIQTVVSTMDAEKIINNWSDFSE